MARLPPVAAGGINTQAFWVRPGLCTGLPPPHIHNGTGCAVFFFLLLLLLQTLSDGLGVQ